MHLAIIMDGNGRWGEKHSGNRIDGHRVGSEVVREITTFSANHKNIDELTLYAFSTENWQRPKLEVDFLMTLLAKYLDSELDTYLKNGVRFRAVGDISRFSNKLQKSIFKLEEDTKNEKSLIQNLAINYGSKNEIVRSIKKLIENGDEVSENNISKYLDVPNPVDLLIRTGGDSRISNFLLWQLSYTELRFSNTLWPDFSINELKNILDDFYKTNRKFGGI